MRARDQSEGSRFLTEPEVSSPDDHELVLQAQSGDMAAFEELVRRHQRGLFSYLYRMCRNTSDAEEMAQAALIKAWEKLSGFRGASSFKTWLYRIGTNLCFNLRTRRKPTEELTETLTAPDWERPESAYNQRVREEAVRKALARLSADQRAALVLSVYEDMSYKEIAETLGKTVRAVDSLLFRAKTNLRRALAEDRAKGII
ncbi:MAG TPA: sigma-70 family RNA polymerase sigma factor [bacterium]|nr:sigma-70 family RNA polymerase sigma factor [bacterium]